MRLARATPAPLPAAPRGFETLREVTALVDPRRRTPTARQLMRASHLHCQKGGHERTGAECLDCERIVSIKPSPGRSYVTVRCLWTEDDRVESVMTHASAAVTVKASDTLGHADQVAAGAGVHHLLVVEHDAVVGIVCRCDLADAGSLAGLLPLAAHVEHELFTVPPQTSLAAAAEVMQRLEVGILMVTEGADLLGIITMRDLGLTPQGHGR